MSQLSRLSLAAKLMLAVSTAFIVLSVALVVSMNRAQDKVIDAQADDLARTVANRIEVLRKQYTKHVVEKLKGDFGEAVKTVSNPMNRGEIPLPAVFVHLVNEGLAENQEGASKLSTSNLISGWNINSAKGLGGDFEQEGWRFIVAQQDAIREESHGNTADYEARLKAHQWEPYRRRMKNEKGEAVYRFMTADPAQAASCVACHNALEKTPQIVALRRSQGIEPRDDRNPFHLNEVMGAVTVTVPIEAVGKTAASATRSVVFIFLIFAAAAFAIIFMVIKNATSRIQALTAATARIVKDGDLTQKVAIDSHDEIGELAATFQQMVNRLKEVPLTIRGAVKDLASAAAEIYAASQEQEAAAQQQSSAVEEVSRTMQSLLEAASHISDSARGVLSNAERAKETSDLTVRKIIELNTHTSRMAETLDVIREIADRSDLLALNASLEGTRAGEAGRGFSLVAAEMRRLAERVTASVKDVKSLVSDVRSSGSSTVLATEEAKKLSESTNESARQISMVTQQQKTATEQVTRGMKDISSVLTQSVSATRQTRTAAENLKGQAEKLNQVLSRFRFDEERA